MEKILVGLLVTTMVYSGCSDLQLVRKTNVQDKKYKDELIEVAKRVYARELVSGTGGDISVRIPGKGRFIIKATGVCLGDLDYDKIATVGLNGKIFEDSPQPSHETNIHCYLYNHYDNLGAIMHMHSHYATTWASCGKTIPPITQQSVKPLKSVGIVPYYAPGTKELFEAVVKCYENPETQVVMMENHGTFIVGTDLYDVLYKAEVVENTAGIAYLCRDIGTPKKFRVKKKVIYKSPQ